MAPRKVELFEDDGRIRSFEDIERDVLRFILAHCGGSMTTAARALKIGRSTAYRKLDELHRTLAKLTDSGTVEIHGRKRRRL